MKWELDAREYVSGKRMSLNLDGERVQKLDRLVRAEVGNNHTAVIQRLIDDADYA